MRRADFNRAEYSPRRFVTKAFQVAKDFSESQVDVSFDVLEEASNRSNCFDMSFDVRPEVPGVFCTSSLSSRTERLAGITASEHVNAVSKALRWQGFKIRPHRSRNQFSLFHLRNQVGNCEGFDLHMSDDSMRKPGKLKSSLNAAVPSAEAEDSW
jgi:hypothetical protein